MASQLLQSVPERLAGFLRKESEQRGVFLWRCSMPTLPPGVFYRDLLFSGDYLHLDANHFDAITRYDADKARSRRWVAIPFRVLSLLCAFAAIAALAGVLGGAGVWGVGVVLALVLCAVCSEKLVFSLTLRDMCKKLPRVRFNRKFGRVYAVDEEGVNHVSPYSEVAWYIEERRNFFVGKASFSYLLKLDMGVRDERDRPCLMTVVDSRMFSPRRLDWEWAVGAYNFINHYMEYGPDCLQTSYADKGKLERLLENPAGVVLLSPAQRIRSSVVFADKKACRRSLVWRYLVFFVYPPALSDIRPEQGEFSPEILLGA